ncbi:DUF6545 domain-containing protein [Streptomyces sp. NPDC005141]
MAGSRIDSTLAYLRLAPLSRCLADGTVGTAALSRWSSAHMRLPARETGIQDGIIRIAPHLDPAIRHSVQQAAVAAGASRCEAQAIGDAAMVVIAASGATLPGQPARLVTTREHLVRVSRVIRTPIVKSFRDHALESPRVLHRRRDPHWISSMCG